MAHNVSKTIQVNGQQFDYTDATDEIIWHKSDGWYNGFSAHNNPSNTAVVSNVQQTGLLYFAPFVVEKDITITEFTIRLNIAEANRKATVGIYNSHSTNGLPNDLVISFGEYSFPTTSAVNKTGYSQLIAKGTYYFAYTLIQTTSNTHRRNRYDSILGVNPNLPTGLLNYLTISTPFVYSTTLPTNVNASVFTSSAERIGIQYAYKIL